MRRKPTRRKVRQESPVINIGAIPGDYRIDPKATKPPGYHAFAYSGATIREVDIGNEAELHSFREDLEVGENIWVDLQGLGDESLLVALSREFRLHPLALEDIVHVNQRAKADGYDDSVLIVMRMPGLKPPFHTEQLSIVLGKDWVITFQEEPGDVFEPIRDRLRRGLGRIRRKGADYLAYAIIDAVVDAYFPILESVGDRIDALEDILMEGNPDSETASQIHALRREVVSIRRAVWPLRDALRALGSDDQEFMGESTRLFVRDAQDHSIRILDMVEGYRETVGSLMDIYLSSVSNRMNEIMQVLTVVSTTFIPITFIAGLYGMNFDPEVSPWNMPETKWYWGYPFSLGLMAVMAGALLYFFRRKGWLGKIDRKPKEGSNE